MGLAISYQSDLIHFDPGPKTSGTALGLMIDISEGPNPIVIHRDQSTKAAAISGIPTDPDNVAIFLVPCIPY